MTRRHLCLATVILSTGAQGACIAADSDPTPTDAVSANEHGAATRPFSGLEAVDAPSNTGNPIEDPDGLTYSGLAKSSDKDDSGSSTVPMTRIITALRG